MDKLTASSFLVTVCGFVMCIQFIYADGSLNVDAINCTSAVNCSSVKNATCESNKCTCKGPFKIAGPKCAWKVLNDTCSVATDCVHVTNSSCGKNSKCTCTGAFKVSGATCAKRVAGDTCTATTDCPSNGNCNNHTCSCKTGYIVDNGLCLSGVGKVCTETSECVSKAECDTTTKKCKCTSGYDASDGLCSKHSSAISLKLTISLLVVSVLTVVFERVQ